MSTSGTDRAASYVGLTRGRDRNTAYCVTLAVPDDAEPGEAGAVEERTGRAVLADIIGRDEHDQAHADTSALAQTALAEEAARSTKVSVDRIAEDVANITAARTGAVLDQLAADGALSPSTAPNWPPIKHSGQPTSCCAPPDIRETSARDATEDTDAADRHRIPNADETAAAVARAQAALAEIDARRQADDARAAEDAARAEQLNRWAEDDRAADQAATAAADDELLIEQ